MEKSYIIDKFYNQIALDYGCTLEQVVSHENIVVKKKLVEGRRQFHSDDYLFKVISLNGKAIFSVEESVYNEIEIIAGKTSAPWINIFPSLMELNDIANKNGYHMDHQHHFYLPTGKEYFSDEEFEKMIKNIEFNWYEGEAITKFQGDNRFRCALTFKSSAPDMICVTGTINGQLAGMAGCSKDSNDLWQIGIDVFPEARGNNIGPILTILLKREIMNRGKVPFYGTAESHIQSQKVAVKSGFMPAWWEAYAFKN